MLRKLLFIFSLILLVTSAPTKSAELPQCNGGESLIAFVLCAPTINELGSYMKQFKGENPSPEAYQNMTRLCEKSTSCLAPLNCKEAQEAKDIFEKGCNLLSYLTSGTQPCLMEFFKELRSLKYSNESSCLRDYNFLDTNLTKRHQEYHNGESCFLDFVKSKCSQSSIDFFSKGYNKFVDTIAIKPEGAKCSDPHFQVNAIQCKSYGTQVKIAMNLGNTGEVDPADPRITNIIQLCQDTQTCMKENPCVFKEDAIETVERACSLMEIVPTNFGKCLAKIKKEKADLSKYECLEDTDFHDATPRAACEKFKLKKECTKTIMKDFCGEESIDNFETRVDTISRHFEC